MVNSLGCWILDVESWFDSFIFMTQPNPKHNSNAGLFSFPAAHSFFISVLTASALFVANSVPGCWFVSPHPTPVSPPCRHCPRCQGLRDATKTLRVYRMPVVLLLQLKRFRYSGPFRDKIVTEVSD